MKAKLIYNGEIATIDVPEHIAKLDNSDISEEERIDSVEMFYYQQSDECFDIMLEEDDVLLEGLLLTEVDRENGYSFVYQFIDV